LTDWWIGGRTSPPTKIVATRSAIPARSVESSRGSTSESEEREPRAEITTGTIEQINCSQKDQKLLAPLLIA
jgi:hypothetical protein